MTRTSRLAVSAVALALAAGSTPALAQSTGTQDWTGPYIGLFGGATETNDQSDETLRFDRNLDGNFGDPVTLGTAAGADAFSPGFCGGAAQGPTVAQGCDDDSGGAQGGIRAGYDFQFGNFVVGVVGDYSVLDQKDSVTGYSTTPASYTFTRTVQSMGALRARAGYAFGPALAYVTGGGAVAEVDNDFRTSNGANTFNASVDDDKAEGYQWGGGLEYRLAPNLSVTGEYLYTSLDAGDNVIRVGAGTAPAANPFIQEPNTTGTDIIRSNSRFGFHAINIGMAYRF